MAEQYRPIAVAPGVHVLPLPTPFHVGDVNAVLVQGERTVLFDCGPDTTDALTALETQLAQLGTSPEGLDLLVLTHPHPDHFGLAAAIVARTGVPTAALDAGVPIFERWTDWAEAADQGICDELVSHGLPETVAFAVLYGGFVHKGFAHDVAIDRPLDAGETIDLGDRELDVHHVPGHSPADTVFHDRAAKLLVGGDHLLASMPSVALAQRLGHDWSGPWPLALVHYRASLRRIAELDVDVVAGGHGAPFGDHARLASERLASHDRRAAQLRDLIGEAPRTAFELAQELWGDTVLQKPYATLSTVLGHLDLLVARGAVEEIRVDGMWCFVNAHRATLAMQPAHETAGRVAAFLARPATTYPAGLTGGLGSNQEGGA